MAHAFFLGIDVNSDGDEAPFDVNHAFVEKSTDESDGDTIYRLDRIRKHENVSSPAEMADQVQALVAERPYIGRTTIIVNRTPAFGADLFNALKERGLTPVGARLTEGSSTSVSGETDEIGVRLSGVDAVRTLADLYRDDSFVIEGQATETVSRVARDVQALAERLDEADGDEKALGATTAGPSFDSEAIHVNSSALAVWLATERSFDPSQHLKESPQTGAVSGSGAE